MKKLLFSVICTLSAMSVFSQQPRQEQDPWVGDWTSESYTEVDFEASPKDSDGTFIELVYTQYKKIFRITKDGDQYTIRGKTIKLKDPDWTDYHHSYTVTSVTGNTMKFQSFVSKLPFRVNGRIDSYSDNTYYYSLTLKNGYLHYSYYNCHSVEYDKNMRYKYEEDLNIPRESNELDLFNDNW